MDVKHRSSTPPPLASLNPQYLLIDHGTAQIFAEHAAMVRHGSWP